MRVREQDYLVHCDKRIWQHRASIPNLYKTVVLMSEFIQLNLPSNRSTATATDTTTAAATTCLVVSVFN